VHLLQGQSIVSEFVFLSRKPVLCCVKATSHRQYRVKQQRKGSLGQAAAPCAVLLDEIGDLAASGQGHHGG
jgi:hypothetical protein